MNKQPKKSRKVKTAKTDVRTQKNPPVGTGTLGGIRARRAAQRGLSKQ